MRWFGISKLFVFLILSALLCFAAYTWFEGRQLAKVIERLSADSRIAEVLVTEVKADAATGNVLTTIKFLEYDTRQRPLEPKFFTFSGNVIQFQSLVIRFDDLYIRGGDALRGKSAYLFMKAFSLKDSGTEVFTINNTYEVPSGYRAEGVNPAFQAKLWRRFWAFALEPESARRMGVKNAQIEAPGTMFVKGVLYIIKIEHDGGMRIDNRPLPAILKGERVDF